MGCVLYCSTNYISSILLVMRKHVNKKNAKRALHLGLVLAGLMVLINGARGAGA